MKVKCDRCENEIEGDMKDGFTTNYYETGLNSHWKKFANSGESIVCDKCMHEDGRYIKVYGKRKVE